MATVFRPPLITKFQPSDPNGISVRAEGEVWNNRLLSLLKSQDQFFGPPGMGPDYDWPNPIGPIYPVSLRTHIDSYKLTLIGKDKIFSAPGETKTYDYPNPCGKPHSIDLKTHINTIRLNLLNQDKFYGAAGESKIYDWPNPLSPSRISQTGYATNLFLGYLNIQNPFYQLDWPNPSGKDYPTILRTFLNQLKLELLGQDQFFGVTGMGPKYDYPNPRSQSWTIQGQISNPTVLGSAPVIATANDYIQTFRRRRR